MTEVWPTTSDALAARQIELSQLTPDPWFPESVVAIAGCFVCFSNKGGTEYAWAAVALTRNNRFIDVISLPPRPIHPTYEPGLLALREGAVLEAAVRSLPHAADVLIVNATGRDHPRGAGLALHLGAVVGIPSIGVTDRPLVATGEQPAGVKGATSPLRIGEEEVGCWLRTRSYARPAAVHAGWRTDPETAVVVALKATRRARTPEPIRRARRAARLARVGRGPITR